MGSQLQNIKRVRRHDRIRKKLAGTSLRPRLVVNRGARNISAQIIDDSKGVTLASASSLEKEMREALKTGANIEAAKQIGLRLAERAKAAGVGKVVFDRGGYLYHGRVKALAEGAREGGLDF